MASEGGGGGGSLGGGFQDVFDNNTRTNTSAKPSRSRKGHLQTPVNPKLGKRKSASDLEQTQPHNAERSSYGGIPDADFEKIMSQFDDRDEFEDPLEDPQFLSQYGRSGSYGNLPPPSQSSQQPVSNVRLFPSNLQSAVSPDADPEPLLS